MFHKLTERIYVRPYEHRTDRPNIGLIRGTKGTLLFDAGNSGAHVASMKQELADAALPEPNYVVLSHWHWDHCFGAHAWNAPIIAGRDTNGQLQQMQRWKWDDRSMQERLDLGLDIAFCTEKIKQEYPDRSQIQVRTADIVFDRQLTVDLGDVACQLIHARGPHSEDSLICYVPSEKFVFLSDSSGKDLYGLPWHFDIEHEEDFSATVAALPYDRQRLQTYLELLDRLDFTHCIGGHSKVQTRTEFFRSFP